MCFFAGCFTFRRAGAAVCTAALSVLLFAGAFLHAESDRRNAAGIVWGVQGTWLTQENAATLKDGDLIAPGALLQPDSVDASHSITVLLPDGRRILYECFTARDCARGFRVPLLYRSPDPSAIAILGRIHAAMVQDRASLQSVLRDASGLPRDEALAAIDSHHQAFVTGLVSALPNGNYSYAIRPVAPEKSEQLRLTAVKATRKMNLSLPAAGLYQVTISDALHTPRIDLFVAAISRKQMQTIGQEFQRARSLLKQWNADYYGWPIHDLQRVYLAALVLAIHREGQSIAPQTPGPKNSTAVTAEPSFVPIPGIYRGDTAVRLESRTSGAVVHFTVNGSEPTAASPVYCAPIMVKGTELTIKSFAHSSDRKDSPVVTGIYRIQP